MIRTESFSMETDNTCYLLFSYVCLCEAIETHLGLHKNCPKFLSEFNQIWSLSTDFYKIFQYQI